MRFTFSSLNNYKTQQSRLKIESYWKNLTARSHIIRSTTFWFTSLFFRFSPWSKDQQKTPLCVTQWNNLWLVDQLLPMEIFENHKTSFAPPLPSLVLAVILKIETISYFTNLVAIFLFPRFHIKQNWIVLWILWKEFCYTSSQ